MPGEEASRDGDVPPGSCLQPGGRCAQHHGLFHGPGTPLRGPGQGRLRSGQGDLLRWVGGIRGAAWTRRGFRRAIKVALPLQFNTLHADMLRGPPQGFESIRGERLSIRHLQLPSLVLLEGCSFL